MTLGSREDEDIAGIFSRLAIDAGAAIMRVFSADPNARTKSDKSPVCDADLFGEAVILEGLARELPDLQVVAEERCAIGGAPSSCAETFVLVDALDGTKEFLARRDTFTVNIALIRRGAPVAGVVHAPARQEIFVAGATARRGLLQTGEWRELRTRPMPERDAIAVVSLSHRDADTDAFLARLPVGTAISTGSSLKLCLVAAGEADVYPRFGRTMEWDIAAGDAVLRRAGGCVAGASGAPFVYGKAAEKFANGPFVAWGDPQAAKRYMIPPVNSGNATR